MVLKVDPYPVEAHQAGHLIQGGIHEVERGDQSGLPTCYFLFDSTGTHGVRFLIAIF